MSRASINVSPDYAQRLKVVVGPSRTVSASIQAMIEWLEKMPREARTLIFDDEFSPDVEARVLEMMLSRARMKAMSHGRGCDDEEPGTGGVVIEDPIMAKNRADRAEKKRQSSKA